MISKDAMFMIPQLKNDKLITTPTHTITKFKLETNYQLTK